MAQARAGLTREELTARMITRLEAEPEKGLPMSTHRPIDPLLAGIQPAARPAECSCPTFHQGEFLADVVARGAWPFCRHATPSGRLLAALFGQEMPEPDPATPADPRPQPGEAGGSDGR